MSKNNLFRNIESKQLGENVNKNIYDPIVSYGTPAKMIRKRKKGDLYLGEEESGRTKILFFGRDDCYYTIQAYELLNKLNFDV